MKTFDPYKSLGFQCELTLKTFIRNLASRLDGTGISPTQFRLLTHLVADGPLSQAELSEMLSITPPSTVKLIDRMQRDGWVIRKADDKDRRVNKIDYTKKARKVWEEATIHSRRLLKQAYRGISENEINTVITVLAKVRKNLE